MVKVVVWGSSAMSLVVPFRLCGHSLFRFSAFRSKKIRFCVRNAHDP